MPTRPVPTLELEHSLSHHGPVIGMDEVGRGCLAGPVAVGACVSGLTHERAVGEQPEGLADSKYLSAQARTQLVPSIASWTWPVAVCFASASEVDDLGIINALQLAGIRALEAIVRSGVRPGVVILDGPHDWLTPLDDLFSAQTADRVERFTAVGNPRVVTQVKADATSAVVSAASIMAKVSRDHLMETLDDPGYGWKSNKGYAAKQHRSAITNLGASPLHRLTWKLCADEVAQRNRKKA
ncbi:MAG: ribonuclease HII [Actinomycetaceae bacterium]|nr:ribonuclease HII [Actinomycetaceae bacterium]